MSNPEQDDADFIVECSHCHKKYDCVIQGKMRMGLGYCSIECADKDWPNFNEFKPHE